MQRSGTRETPYRIWQTPDPALHGHYTGAAVRRPHRAQERLLVGFISSGAAA